MFTCTVVMCTHVFHMLLHVYYRLCRFRFLCMAYYMYIVCEWFRYDLKVTIGVCTFCVRRRYMYTLQAVSEYSLSYTCKSMIG